MKSAQLCGVPASGGSADETYTVTVSPVLALVGPPVQSSAPLWRRPCESIVVGWSMAREAGDLTTLADGTSPRRAPFPPPSTEAETASASNASRARRLEEDPPWPCLLDAGRI